MQSKRSARPMPLPTRTETITPGMEAKAARPEAGATNAQFQAMQALTDAALSHLALDDLLRELLDRVTAGMDVGNLPILLLDQDGRTLTRPAARGPLHDAVCP